MLRSLSSDNLMPPRPKFLQRGTTTGSNDKRGQMNQGMSTADLMNGLGAGSSHVRKLAKGTLGAAKGVTNVGLNVGLEAAKGVTNVGVGAVKGVALATDVAAEGLVMGVKGVGAGAAVGAAYGFELGAAGAAGAAGLANGVLGRPKASTCRRRVSEFNVLGNGDLVSVDFVLQNIRQAEKKKDVTKLELEDLVNGKARHDPAVYSAVSSLLKNDSDRPWKYIKFIDSLRIGICGDGLPEVEHYEMKRQKLWDHIKKEAEGKPIMFSLKLEIEEDTSAKTIIEILNKLLEYNLARIEYMGALFGFRAPEIGEALANLCKPDDPDASIEEMGELKEMVMLTLHYAAGNDKKESSPTRDRDRVWKKVLRRCVKRMGGQVPPSLGDSEHGFGARSRSKSPLGSSEHSRGRSRRSASPKSPSRKKSEPDLMRAAINANRSKSPKKCGSSPNLVVRPPPLGRRAVSEGTPSQKVNAHGKRRKPRSFASAIPEDYDDLDESEGNCSIGDSANSFAADDSSSRRSMEDNSRKHMNDNSNHDNKKSSKPLRRRQGVVKQGLPKPDTIDERSVSDKPYIPQQERRSADSKKLSKCTSHDEDAAKALKKPNRIKKCVSMDGSPVPVPVPPKRSSRSKSPCRRSTSSSNKRSQSPANRRSTSPPPAYDWRHHSGGDMDWGKHAAAQNAAASDTGELDDSQTCVAKTA